MANWHRNSLPFLSGDLFSDESDISIGSPRLRRAVPSYRDLKNAKVIFCKSDLLEDFLIKYKGVLSARIIIAGNSDFEFRAVPKNLPPSISALILQNSFISDNEWIFTLPIGIENMRWGVNGFPSLMQFNNQWTSKSASAMVGPFGLTHPERANIFEEFLDFTGPISFYKERLRPRDYASEMCKFRFVAAVRGNGVDTHRHWESLYRGSYPIVKTDAWSRSLRILGLPFIEIDNWSRETITQTVNEDVPQFPDRIQLSALWWPFWKEKIKGLV
jgi:hypothetical protein